MFNKLLALPSSSMAVLPFLLLLLLLLAAQHGCLSQGSDLEPDPNLDLDFVLDLDAKVPNGRHVPDPCDPGDVWRGVAGQTDGGRGGGGGTVKLNPFGQDFARHGYKWGRAVCEADSDGDGRTNGEELGDPTCVWREGDLPLLTHLPSHPGICDPWNSPQCASNNAWLRCDDVTDFKCDAIHEQGVQSLELRFPRSRIDSGQTGGYLCSVFEVPSDKIYHVLAVKPVVDNAKVLRHIAAFACDDTVEVSQASQQCGGSPIPGCTALLDVWRTGSGGHCYSDQAALRIGKGAASKIALQLHWWNAGHVDHWYDSSGLTLFYTPSLRPYDAGTMLIGQSFLEIPPGIPRLVLGGSCSSQCTSRLFTGPVYVTGAQSFMRTLGISGKIEVIREGHVVYNLTNDISYSFDHPPVTRFASPVKINPGDEIKVVCFYSSLQRNETTFSGYGPREDMCYGLLDYYPKQNGPGSCVQWRNTDTCVFEDPEFKSTFITAFNVTVPETAAAFQKISDNCNVYGHCRQECKQALTEIRSAQPLYRGEMWEYAKTVLWENKDVSSAPLLRFLSAIDTCDRHDSQSASATSSCSHPTSSSQLQTGTNVTANVMQLVRLLGSRPLLQNVILNVIEGN